MDLGYSIKYLDKKKAFPSRVAMSSRIMSVSGQGGPLTRKIFSSGTCRYRSHLSEGESHCY